MEGVGRYIKVLNTTKKEIASFFYESTGAYYPQNS